MSAQNADANASKEVPAQRRPECKESSSSYGTMNAEQSKMIETQGLIGTYDIERVSSWKVFGLIEATVLQDVTLWKETGMLACVFWMLFLVVFIYRPPGFSEIIGKEAGIRAFLAMFSTLIGLLLSFYTAISLGRWWQMRLGVLAIQDACKRLIMMVSQGVTQDEILLDAIQRYARASLYLIFAASQHEEGQEAPLVKALQTGLLKQDEVDKLQLGCPHGAFAQAETLWAWLANTITRLHKKGLTQGAPHYCALIAAVEHGRSGVTSIQTHLETPIPLGYVHLLCLMVKLHNFIVTILLALTSVMLSGGVKGFQPVGVCRTAFRAFFMPFLYNAILILNANVADPFGSDPGDFKLNQFDLNISMRATSFAFAAENPPECLTRDDIEPLSKV